MKKQPNSYTHVVYVLTTSQRKKGGRGKTVVWSIYSFDGKGFTEQTGADYGNYYDLIGDYIDNRMKKSELSKDSLEYIQLSINFWGGESVD